MGCSNYFTGQYRRKMGATNSSCIAEFCNNDEIVFSKMAGYGQYGFPTITIFLQAPILYQFNWKVLARFVDLTNIVHIDLCENNHVRLGDDNNNEFGTFRRSDFCCRYLLK
jgi:hypothetical protein